jgi:hypothetical protein
MSNNAYGRTTRVYNKEERAVIDQYKTQYLEATSPLQRKDIAQMQIFPSLFNYWTSIGEVVNSDEQKLRSDVCFFFFKTGFKINLTVTII